MSERNKDPGASANQSLVLNEIRKAGLISRVEIAERAGLSRSAVTNVTAELLRNKFIIETETQASTARGRRRMLLALNPDAAYVAGVKISAFQVSFAVIDFTAEVKSSLVTPVRTGERPAEFLADVVEEGIRHCVREARLDLAAISGIGVGIPGFVDARTGACHWTPLHANREVSLKDLIQERLKIPTSIENDANAVTVAEQWFGLGRGIDHFLVVTVEEGVGMGIVVNGELYTGARGVAAEFGHMVIDPDGPPCRCGKRGCIEAYASGGGVMRAVREAVAAGRFHHPDAMRLTMPEVIVLAKQGDPVLREIFQKAGQALGMGVAGLLQIFNPARMIITGEYAGAGDALFGPMREFVTKHVHPEFLVGVDFKIQTWADTDWARGAAGLALREICKAPFEETLSRPAGQNGSGRTFDPT